MGTLKILENLGEGRYKVEILKDLTRIKSRIKNLNEQIDTLDKESEELKKKKQEAKIAEAEERVKYDLAVAELNNLSDLIDQANIDLSAKEFELDVTEQNLQSEKNMQTGLQNAINSGTYTGQDLANLQSQLSAIKVHIDELEDKKKGLEADIKALHSKIQTLNNPAKQIADLEKVSSGMWDKHFEAQRYDISIQINTLMAQKKRKAILDYEKVETKKDERDVWCVDYAIDLPTPASIQSQIDQITNEIAGLIASKEALQNQLDALIGNGANNDDAQVKALKTDIKNNSDKQQELRDKREALELKTKRVSVDINDENNHILIAPHTYVVTQKDLDEKEAYIQGKIDEKDKIGLQADKKQIEIDERQSKILEEYTKIAQKSLEIANIDVNAAEVDQTAAREFLMKQIDEIKAVIQTITKEIIKLTKEMKKLHSKERNIGVLILQLNAEFDDLKAAFSKPDKVFEPTVTERTREFQPTQASGEYAVFYNKALLPGFQKWKPTYRLGVIVAMKNDDLCDVKLEPAESSQQSLNINQKLDLVDVKIKYGDCNSAAFEIGDRVVVSFEEREQDKPVVIGFEDHPKPCGLSVFVRRKDPMSTKLYQTIHRNPTEKVQYESEIRYWYSKNRKKSISWWNQQRYHIAEINVGKNAYIKGVTYGFTTKILFNEQIIACCYANEEQTAEILQAFPELSGDFVICMIGEHKKNRDGNIFALDYDSHLTRVVILMVKKEEKTLVWVDDRYSFDVYEPNNHFSYADTEWDVFDSRFSNDSTSFFYAFQSVYYGCHKVDRFDISILASGLTINRTEPVKFFDGVQYATGENIVGGGIDDTYYYFVYSTKEQTNVSGSNDITNRVIINSSSYVFNVFVGRINIQTSQVDYKFQTLFTKVMNGSTNSVYDITGASDTITTNIRTEGLEFVFCHYDGFTKSALFFVSEQVLTLSGSGVRASGYSETLLFNQTVNLYLFKDNTLVFIEKVIPDLSNTSTRDYPIWGGTGGTDTLQPYGSVVLDSGNTNEIISSGVFMRYYAFYVFTRSASGGWQRDISLRYNLRHWIEFDDSWFIKTSKAENNRMIVYYLDIIFVKPGQTVFNYTRRYEKALVYEITDTGLLENNLDGSVNYVSVTG